MVAQSFFNAPMMLDPAAYVQSLLSDTGEALTTQPYHCACPACTQSDIQSMAQCIIDLRTAVLEQNRILEHLLVLTRKKQSLRDSQGHLNTIDLIRDLLGADDADAGDSSQVD